MLLAAGLGLSACTTSEQPPAQTSPTSTSASPSRIQPTQALKAVSSNRTSPSSPTAKTQSVALQVNGAKAQALVKTLVITSAGKKSSGNMTSQSLPFEETIELTAGESITKILVLAKYTDGQTGEIACSISIDGKQISTDTTTSHKPAQCLVTNP